MSGPSRIEHKARRVARERRRRALRRRRLALLLITGAIVAVVAVVAFAGGSARPSGHASAGAASSSSAAAGTRGAGSKGATVLGPPGTKPVPILMYHVIAAPPAGAPFPGLYVPPQEFAEQMQALRQAGWHAVTLDQVEAYWSHGVPLGTGKPIVLSFDNGYNSQYTQALPVLQRLGWVGVENIQLSGLPPSQGGLGSDQVRGLLAAGWELDTQGFSHADLVALSSEALHYQVAVAREQLRRRYHVPVNWFCYPSGHYNASVIAAVREAGFKGSTTVVPGWAHPREDRYRLPRLRVLGGTGGAQLVSELQSVRGNPAAPASYGT